MKIDKAAVEKKIKALQKEMATLRDSCTDLKDEIETMEEVSRDVVDNLSYCIDRLSELV